MSERVSEFRSERTVVLRRMEFLFVQTRSLWLIFCVELVGLYSSFLTE